MKQRVYTALLLRRCTRLSRRLSRHAPFEAQRLDVETQRGADSGYVVAIEPLHQRGLPCIV
jgi:hypothetical protein